MFEIDIRPDVRSGILLSVRAAGGHVQPRLPSTAAHASAVSPRRLAHRSRSYAARRGGVAARSLWPGVTYDRQFSSRPARAGRDQTCSPGRGPGGHDDARAGALERCPHGHARQLTGDGAPARAVRRRPAASTATSSSLQIPAAPSGILHAATARSRQTTSGYADRSMRRRHVRTERSTSGGSSFFGTWQGAGLKHDLSTLKRAATGEREARSTRRPGVPSTPSVPGSAAVILFPFLGCRSQRGAALAPRTVEGRRRGAAVPIPPGRRRPDCRADPEPAALNAEAVVGSDGDDDDRSSTRRGLGSSTQSAAGRRSFATARPLSRGRGVHVEPARSPRAAAHSRRPARRRAHPARHRGRPAAGLLGRHDQLRARPDARAA